MPGPTYKSENTGQELEHLQKQPINGFSWRRIASIPLPPPPPTGLLNGWARGDQAALHPLLPLVHEELRRLARWYMKRERPGHTLQATTRSCATAAGQDGCCASCGAQDPMTPERWSEVERLCQAALELSVRDQTSAVGFDDQAPSVVTTACNVNDVALGGRSFNTQLPDALDNHCQRTSGEVRRMPRPSPTVTIWFAATFRRTSVRPEGQRMSIRSARVAAPSPKCARRSFCDR